MSAFSHSSAFITWLSLHFSWRTKAQACAQGVSLVHTVHLFLTVLHMQFQTCELGNFPHPWQQFPAETSAAEIMEIAAGHTNDCPVQTLHFPNRMLPPRWAELIVHCVNQPLQTQTDPIASAELRITVTHDCFPLSPETVILFIGKGASSFSYESQNTTTVTNHS